jgi:hypothetical protein
MTNEEFITEFGAIAEKLGALSIHISRAFVCDNCKDASKEAHPYGMDDRTGKYWDILCNECFDKLGCAHSDSGYGETETCEECGGTGVIITCCDDMCVGGDHCIHGDGEMMCPTCEGDGIVWCAP